MKTVSAFLAVAGLITFVAQSADASDDDDYDLIAQAAAERQDTPVTMGTGQEPRVAVEEPDDLGELERAARIKVTLAQAELELVLARKALRRNNLRDAAVRAQRVLNLLKELPREVDASVYELQAEGILARAERAGIDMEALRAQAAGEPAWPGFDDYLDDQARAAARVARRYTGADRDTIDTRAEARTLRQRTLRRQVPDDYGYRPGKEIFDTEAVLERDRQRVYYEDALRSAYKADEARLLTQADEARVVPEGDIAYPDDWPDKVAKRAKYAGGEMARSESWIDKDGREWYVAIYDIRDLIYVPPDFQPAFSLEPAENLRNTLDRHALRLYSGIFNSYYPADIAAGIPLLRYFGGLDDFEFRGPKYSVERQQQIVEMIKAFTTQITESKIIPLAP
ncbi:MAG: hypothetical protein ACE5I3_01905 [Phycisphaerae bacterium]